MNETTDFDARLRQLVADAVVDAPTAPPMPRDAGRLRPVRPSRRWPLRVAVGSLVAASTVAIALTMTRERPGGQISPTGSEPSASTSTEPVVPSTSSPTTVSSTVPGVTAPQVSFPDVASLESPPAVVVNGPDGTTVDGELWSSEVFATALQLPDGRLLVQRQRGTGEWLPADTAPLVIDAPGSGPQPLVVPGVDFAGQWLRLHDAAWTGSGPTLLIEQSSTLPVNIESPASQLLTVGLVDGAITLVDGEFSGWEQGSTRMHLAANGIVVGERFYGPARSLAVYAPNVENGPSLDAAVLGVDPEYVDCDSCPSLFTIDPSGRTIAWIDGAELVIWDVPSRTERTRAEIGQAFDGASDLHIDGGVVVVERNLFDPLNPLVITMIGHPIETVEVAAVGGASLGSFQRRCDTGSYELVEGDTPIAVAAVHGLTIDDFVAANTATPEFSVFSTGLVVIIPPVNCG